MTQPNARRTRLPARYAAIILPLILSGMMTFIVSGISTIRVLGLAPHIVSAWMGAWFWSWVAAFPALLVLLPLARRIAALIVEPPPAAPR